MGSLIHVRGIQYGLPNKAGAPGQPQQSFHLTCDAHDFRFLLFLRTRESSNPMKKIRNLLSQA
ncbi:hypothetical protein BN874_1580019 [Candidatus Contendobacter odensis Run_B_J11]|uniref:Uncharacterized protein n=1 Tax=Candidatus Contendobacter odensis Run_B_J11 TaxID=1400861 RepID=A0A7U7G9P9_9GAMM|nr:hypothetical protein BN874_1580019 [Candidatus Contendobacter odensis Run_B_J11]